MDWLLPTGLFAEHAIVAAVAFAVTGLAVLLHYEGVHWLARRFSGRDVNRTDDRRAMLKIICALFGLHLLEIWMYGLAYWGLLRIPGAGDVHGANGIAGASGIDTLFDAVYLSATTYSTLGIGDLAPVGAIRMLSGMESLVGLLLITWSATFTYLEMSRLWRDRVD